MSEMKLTRNFAVFFIVLVSLLSVLTLFNAFDSDSTGSITGLVSLETDNQYEGFTIISNNETIEEEIANITINQTVQIEIINETIKDINDSVEEYIKENDTALIEENLTEAENNVTEDNLIENFEKAIKIENNFLENKINAVKKSISEFYGIINSNSTLDYYCEDISPFIKRCLIQDEKEFCEIEGDYIVCDPTKTEFQSLSLKSADINTLEEKGIPIFRGEYEIVEENNALIQKPKYEYFNPAERKIIEVDWNKDSFIHIGFTSDNFYIQDFYYGDGENVSIDVGVELSPIDDEITLPQSNDNVLRLDFVDDASDTSGYDNFVLNFGADHVHERYVFDDGVKYIIVDHSDYLNFSNKSISFGGWFKQYGTGISNNQYSMYASGKYSMLNGYTTNGVLYCYAYNETDDANVASSAGGTLKFNEWYHAMCTVDIVNHTLKGYVNGQLVASNTFKGHIKDNTNDIYISPTGYGYNGSIENIYVWNTSLSQQEIQQIYNQTRFNTSGNTQDYHGLFTGGAVDSDSFNTIWHNLSWSESNPTGTAIDVRYSLGNYSTPEENINGLVGLWKMNRSDVTNLTNNSAIDAEQVLHLKFNNLTDLMDYTGLHVLTNSGSGYTQEGYIKGTRSFDGYNDRITFSSGNGVNFSESTPHTVSLWFKLPDISSDNPLISNYIGGGGSKLYVISNQISFIMRNSTGGFNANAASIAGRNNEWIHAVSVFNTTHILLYIDGELADSDPFTIKNTGTSTPLTYLGYAPNNNAYGEGYLDNIRVYNDTALNADEVKFLYSKEAGTVDYTLNQNNGLAKNGINRIGGIFEGDGALSFDGVDDYVDVGKPASLDISDELTLVAWVKPTGTGAAGQTIAGKEYLGSGTKEWGVYYLSGTSQLAGKICNGSVCVNLMSDFAVEPNEWSQVVVTRNSSGCVKLFTNSIEDSSSGCIDGDINNPAYDFTIGVRSTKTASFFNGSIDSVAVYDRALSKLEVESLYANWSGWSQYYDTSPVTIDSSGNRLLKYQARLNTTNNSNTPVLGDFNIAFSYDPPVITLDYPSNDSTLYSNIMDLVCSAETSYAGLNISNITLYIWNSVGALIYSNTKTGGDSPISRVWNYTLPSKGDYEFNCEAIDSQGKSSFAVANNTFSYESITPEIIKDIDVEIRPVKNVINLPHSSDLVARFDFIDDASDSAGSYDGTARGTTHRFERYSFDGVDDYISLSGIVNPLNATYSLWFSSPDIETNALQGLLGRDGDSTYVFGFLDSHTLRIRSSVIVADLNLGENLLNNNWYNLLVTFQSNGSAINVSVYLDGTYRDSDILENVSYTFNMIGRLSVSNWFFNGSIENVWIWDRVLNNYEIDALYDITRFNTENNTQNFVANYSQAFDSYRNTTSWTNFSWLETEPAGTDVKVRYRFANFSSVDLSDSSLVSYWNMNRSDRTIIMNDSVDDNIVLHLKFNNVSDFRDYSGKGNEGINFGSAYNNKGYILGARSFDGVDDYVSVGNDVSLDLIDEFSFVAWIKTDNIALRQGIVSKYLSSPYPYEWGIMNNRINLRLNDVGLQQTTGNILSVGEWNLITTTYNKGLGSANVKHYINGDLVGTRDYNTAIGTNTNNAYIGKSGSSFPFDGLIDNVRIYNTSLSDDEIKELYSKEAGTYDEKNQNNGIAYNGVDRASGIFEGDGALSFGGNDYIDVGSPATLDFTGFPNVTFVTWVKPSDLATNYRGVFSNSLGGAASTIRFDWQLLNAKRQAVYIGNGTTYGLYASGVDLVEDEWQMIGFTMNNSYLQFYRNGAKSGGLNHVLINIGSSAQSNKIGRGFNSAPYSFIGDMDSFAIYNETLSPTEIQNLYLNWSGWSTYYDASPIDLNGTKSRALQFEAVLNTSDNAVTPVFGSEEVNYATDSALINLTSPINGSSFPRGNNLVPNEDDLDVVDNFIPIIAKVYSNATFQGIPNANCSFYFDGNFIGTSLSNSQGYCTYNYDKTAESIGLHNISVNLISVPNYLIEKNQTNGNTNIEQWLTFIEVGNERPGMFYYEDDIASVFMNITNDGVLTNVTNLTLILLNQLDVVVETLHIENTTVLGTGEYYAEVVVPSNNWLRWKGYSEFNFSSNGILNATSSLHTDVDINTPTANINSTIVNSSNLPYNNSIVIHNRFGPMYKHKIFEEIITTTNPYASRFAVLDDNEYEIIHSMPDTNKLTIERLNVTIPDVKIKTQSADLAAIPADLKEISKVVASNASVFQKAEITIVKNGFEPNKICKCELWNYSSAICDGAWICNNTADYEYASNATHFWFNVTDFTGYAGGGIYNANLTIWDSTDPKGGSHNIYAHDQAMFYANYTNSTSGESINGTNVYCEITVNVSGGWTVPVNMTYNSTSRIYEYNRSFANAGVFKWNVTCNGSVFGYDNLTANDTITVLPDVPAPSINFTPPTTFTGVYPQSWIAANVTAAGPNFSSIKVYLYDNLGALINSSQSATSPLFVNFTNLADGNYLLNATANNTFGRQNQTSTENITLDNAAPQINFTLPTTTAGTHNQTWIYANVSASNVDLANVTIYLYNSTGLVASVMNKTTIVFYNFTGLSQGTYYLNASANDTLSNRNNTETRTIYLDSTIPKVDLVSPFNNVTTYSSSITFRYNLTDYSPNNCTLTLDGVNVTNSTNVMSGINSFTRTVTEGIHNWSVTCTDSLGLSNTSPTWLITYRQRITPVSGGGGGGGGKASNSVNIERLCVMKNNQIEIRPHSNGQLIISQYKDGNWNFLNEINIMGGYAQFMPSELGTYRFDFKVVGGVAGSYTVNAEMCAMEERPFGLPQSLLDSMLANEIYEEVASENIDLEDESIQEAEQELFEEKPIPSIREIKNNKEYLLFAVAGIGVLFLIALVLFLKRLFRKNPKIPVKNKRSKNNKTKRR